MITVAVVDDQVLVRSAVAQLIANEADIRVVGEAGNGREAVALVRRTRPDVVLMDIRMPVMDGIEATAALCSDPSATTRILVLTTFEEDEYVAQALRAGASGFLGKGTDAAGLMSAIRIVHGGEALLSPAATRALISRWLSPSVDLPTHLPGLDVLTSRETEILALVARGLSNIAIAEHLTISTHTAKTHVGRIMSKLAVHDRAQLVIIAYESGLVGRGTTR